MRFGVALLAIVILSPNYLSNPNRSVSSSCTVAIDIGHTESAQGAISSRGVSEYSFNRNMANLLLNKLLSDGKTGAFLIEADDRNMPLKVRAEVAGRRHADIFIAIHHDSVQPKYLLPWVYHGSRHAYSDRFHGFSLFVSQKNARVADSLRVAQYLGSHLRRAGFMPTLHHAERIEGESRELVDSRLGIYYFDDLIVLKAAAMPAVLLECGVIVNRMEELHLRDRKYQGQIAAAVAAGLEQDCDERKRLGGSNQ